MSRRPASFVLLLAASFSVAGGGCVYLPAINGQPDAAIEKLAPTTEPITVDGPTVVLSAAQSTDPDGPAGLIARWHAVYCDDPAATTCPPSNELAIGEGSIDETFEFVPGERKPVRVTLAVEDDRGAVDTTELVIDVVNQDPELTIQRQGYMPASSDAYVAGTAIDLVADGGDLDGDPVEYTWELFTPTGSTAAGWARNDSFAEAYRLGPDVDGLYQIQVTADDGAGGLTEVTVPVLVVDDAPPCLWPDRAAGGAYPVDRDGGPWSVSAIVADDLDGTDQPESEYFLPIGPAFSWQVASPDTGGALLPVEGLDASAYQLDPSIFAPGDRISIRLEVADRVDRTLPCAAGDPSCSIGGDDCYQRLTWEVEIR